MPKIRVTLFNQPRKYTPEGYEESSDLLVIKEDRLVEADTFFAAGVSETHDGPIRVDFLMENNSDAANLIVYLEKLMGKLPLNPKYERKTKTKENMPLERDAVEVLVEEAFEKCKTQNQLIEYLRGLNFVFLTYDYLKDICEKNKWGFETKKKAHQEYQWMARLLKQAKIPLNDKYDPQIYFGIKVVGELVEKVQIYISGSYEKTKALEWDDTIVKFKKPEKFYKFPEPMSYKERATWRIEDRKLLNNPEYIPSKAYTRWKEFVTILKPLKLKKTKEA